MVTECLTAAGAAHAELMGMGRLAPGSALVLVRSTSAASCFRARLLLREPPYLLFYLQDLNDRAQLPTKSFADAQMVQLSDSSLTSYIPEDISG